jgi:acetoin utilization protein AcuB
MTSITTIMTSHPATILASQTLQEAYLKMKAMKIRHLPVVDQRGILVGILSDRDLQRVMQRELVSEIQENYFFESTETVEAVMTRPVFVIASSTTVKTAARLMLQEKLSALVVTDLSNHPKAIVTTDDLLRFIVEVESPQIERPILAAAQASW